MNCDEYKQWTGEASLLYGDYASWGKWQKLEMGARSLEITDKKIKKIKRNLKKKEKKLENTTDRKIRRAPEFDSLPCFSPKPVIYMNILKLFPKVFLMIIIHN